MCRDRKNRGEASPGLRVLDEEARSNGGALEIAGMRTATWAALRSGAERRSAIERTALGISGLVGARPQTSAGTIGRDPATGTVSKRSAPLPAKAHLWRPSTTARAVERPEG